jgi:8-oxo-dGTP pyrophosphatase MutT (NUDIX family)
VTPFNHFAVIAYALVVVALCSLAVTLRTFGVWRWLKYQWADMKAWLFDAEEDDAPWAEVPLVFEAPKPKRKRKKKDAK